MDSSCASVLQTAENSDQRSNLMTNHSKESSTFMVLFLWFKWESVRERHTYIYNDYWNRWNEGQSRCLFKIAM